MAVNFFNFEYSYLNPKNKPVFAPNDEGRRVGATIKKLVEELYAFPAFYRHLRKGAHVSALHDHRRRRHFAKVDLTNFFYSIHRNRVQRSLHDIGVGAARHFAKWSTVKSPYDQGLYVLPYGFVQSPILATLVMDHSALGTYFRSIDERVFFSVYIDDITISSDDTEALSDEFERLKECVEAAGFAVNQNKCSAPTEALTVFNCQLRQSATMVLEERVAEFYSVDRSPESIASFERYCASVAKLE